MDNLVPLKQMRQKLTDYTRRVEQNGESFVVLRKSKPVFKMVPVDHEEEWETVVDFTKIHPNGVPAEKVLKALDKIIAKRKNG